MTEKSYRKILIKAENHYYIASEIKEKQFVTDMMLYKT